MVIRGEENRLSQPLDLDFLLPDCFQGLLVLLAGWIAPVLTPAAIAEMTAAGSLIMVGLGLNLLGVTKIKVADYLPAIVIAPVICWIVSLF